MEAIHKTFTGGYKFGIFEGQPSKDIKGYKPIGDVVSVAIELDGVLNAANVLDKLGRTGFEGPESALVNTEGTIEPSKVKNIVVSTVEVEPYDRSNEAIISGDNLRKFIDGLKSIHISYEKAKITIILGNNQKELIKTITQETKTLTWVNIATITAKYPANMKELSIPTILGVQYPVGYAPAHIGVLFLSVMDVIHVNKAVNEKSKLDTTYISLSGTGWKENVILEVPVGTSVREIKDAYLSDHEIRLIKNSVLTKDAFEEDEIVDFDTAVMIALPEDRKRQTLFFLRAGKNADSFSNSFLSSLLPKAAKTSGTNLHGERRPCVSCTYCQKVCPVGLIPHLLHKHVDKDIINKRLAEYKIFDCIECGLCDYVCPSKIEVSSDIKRGKVMLEASGISHNDYVIPSCDMIQGTKEVESDEKV